MNDGDLLKYMGTDAAKWASEFCKRARDHGHHLDEGWMISWFANALAAGAVCHIIDDDGAMYCTVHHSLLCAPQIHTGATNAAE